LKIDKIALEHHLPHEAKQTLPTYLQNVFIPLELSHSCDRKSLGSMCAKLHTIAASNNRDHVLRSLFAYISHYVQ